MAHFVQEGKILDYTNAGETAIAYGEVIKGTDCIFIAAETIQPGATGGMRATGVFEFPSVKTAAFTVGQKVYWDGSKITNTDTSNTYAGIVVAPKTSSEEIAFVRIG